MILGSIEDQRESAPSDAYDPCPGALVLTDGPRAVRIVHHGRTAQVEVLMINASGSWFALIESSEPLDWTRLIVERADAVAASPVVWSADGKRALPVRCRLGWRIRPEPPLR